MLPFRGAPFTLYSPHAPEECAERLRALTVSRTALLGLVAVLSDKPLIGEVAVTHIEVAKHNRFRRNAMQPMFRATLEPYGDGTSLDCRVGLPIPALVLLAVTIPAFILLGFGLCLAALTDWERGHFNTEKALTGASFLVFIASFVWYGRHLVRGEAEFLERTVIECLEARKVEG